MRLPYFNRRQQGIILLLGAGLLLLWAWRANFFRAPSPPPPQQPNFIFVEVSGPGAHPGVYLFDHPPTLTEIWQKSEARGPTPATAEKVTSGRRVEIGEDGHYQVLPMHGAELLTLGLPLDLNQASAADLAALPGVGLALAQQIIVYRQAHGPFKKIDDLEKVSGIGPKKLEKIKPFLVISEGCITADERR